MIRQDLPEGPANTDHSCEYCRGALDRFGYHFTCHTCGATYCYVHMVRHKDAHRLNEGQVVEAHAP